MTLSTDVVNEILLSFAVVFSEQANPVPLRLPLCFLISNQPDKQGFLFPVRNSSNEIAPLSCSFELTYYIASFLQTVTIQLTNVESACTTQDYDKFNETILLQPEKWVVYMSQTVDSTSLLLVKLSSELSHCIAFEAKDESISVLKVMEVKLREFLRGKQRFKH